MSRLLVWRSAAAAGAVAGAALIAAVAALLVTVDGDLVTRGLATGLSDPAGLMLIWGALLGAFLLRARTWTRLLSGLSTGQALAAIHVALGANHVLPFRLGEPLRIVSVVRRTGVSTGAATATSLVARSADVLTLVALGTLAGPSLVAGHLGWWGGSAVVVVAGVGVAAVVVAQRRWIRSVTAPDATAVAQAGAAWLLEAVVVWRVGTWFGFSLSAAEAVVVVAAAVSAQLVALTPAGVGTYEAAAATALVAVGVPVESAVALALVLHGVKTVYSLVAGMVGLALPGPGLFGRLRLPATIARVPSTDPGHGPVMLFLPAHDEGPRVADVIARTPPRTCGREVVVAVVDDGSTDDTAQVAGRLGAAVIAHAANRGLGAAVRTGLERAVAGGVSAVVFCDADGEYDPGELERLVSPVLDGSAHYVVGSRFAGRIERMSTHRRLGNHALTGLVRFVTRQAVTDGQSGYRALSPTAAAHARIAHDYNYAQVLTIDLVNKGFGYHEVPITYAFRSSGRSFVRPGPYLRRVVPTIWRLVNNDPPSKEELRCPDTDSPPSPLLSR